MKKYFIVFTLSFLMSERLIGAEAGMPQLDPEYWASQAFWLILIFLTIYLLIAKIFIPKIKGNIDTREDKMRKDLEEAKTFREEAEKKLKLYEELIKKAKLESKKIISNSRQKLNEDIQSKKESVQKQIEQEILKAEKEIKKFKLDSIHKVGSISENIVSDLLIDIFGEDGNKSSIKATVSEVVKQRVTKI